MEAPLPAGPALDALDRVHAPLYRRLTRSLAPPRLRRKSLISLSLCALLVVGLAAKAAWRLLRGAPEERARARSTINAGLFWGAFAFVLGVFHTFMGLIMTSLSIGAHAPVVPEEHGLIATGVAVALLEAGQGVVLPVAWFVLGWFAGLGAARAALLLGPRRPDAPLSLAGRTLAYVAGCGVALALPRPWTRAVDLAGFVWIVTLALGGPVGVGEVAAALAGRLRGRRRPADRG